MTLIELLVGVAVALIAALVIATVLQFALSSGKKATSVTVQNNDMRGVLTLLTRDVQSAGFMLGSGQVQCATTVLYDSDLSTQPPGLYPVWAQTQAKGTSLGLTDTAANYPPSGWGNATQELMVTAAPSVPGYLSNGASPAAPLPAPIQTAAFGDWSGAMDSGTVYLTATTGLTAGDMALLQVGMTGGLVCLRIPISTLGSTSIVSTPGTTYMPADGYTGYAALVPSGFGTLGPTQLKFGRLIDMGQSPDALHVIAYWIDGSGAFPVLMRGTFDARTDQSIDSTAIAPGVVSLQALFGTVPVGAATGTAPTYKAWSDVAPNSDTVVAVALAVVSRTLYDDPAYTAPATVVVPQPVSGLAAPDAFTNYTVSAAERHRHFQVDTVTIQLRNATWE